MRKRREVPVREGNQTAHIRYRRLLPGRPVRNQRVLVNGAVRSCGLCDINIYADGKPAECAMPCPLLGCEHYSLEVKPLTPEDAMRMAGKPHDG